MKNEQDYIQDIAEVHSMMERSSKFLSLSGMAGVMAGIYALAGALGAYKILYTGSDLVNYDNVFTDFARLLLLGASVLVLSVSTCIFLSWRKAKRKGEKIWNSTARRVVINMAVPLVTGGILILILVTKGLLSLAAPFTLLFYGLALYNTSKFTYREVRSLGIIEIILGLLSVYFVEYSIVFWAIGFGLIHIVYGIYIHYRYER